MLDADAIWKSLNTRGRLILIAGPCVIESEKLCLRVAAALKKTCADLQKAISANQAVVEAGIAKLSKAIELRPDYDDANLDDITSFSRGETLGNAIPKLIDDKSKQECGDCPNFRLGENGTVPLETGKLFICRSLVRQMPRIHAVRFARP